MQWGLPGAPPPGIPGDPGLFGPGSEVWRVGRERVLLLGGPAALLLQLAHPLVAAGVAEHSRFADDPLARLRATLDATLTITFGDRVQARAAAVRVAAAHRRVQGHLRQAVGPWPAGTRYRARDPHAALWVHATLVATAVEVFDRLVAPLGDADRTRYYEEAKAFAALFGVTRRVLPPTWADFERYLAAMVEEGLAVDRQARELAAAVLAVPSLGALPGLLDPVAPLAAWLLPPRLRRAFGLAWDHRARAEVELLSRAARVTLPLLPPRVRWWPHYRAAARRAAAAASSSCSTQRTMALASSSTVGTSSGSAVSPNVSRPFQVSAATTRPRSLTSGRIG